MIRTASDKTTQRGLVVESLAWVSPIRLTRRGINTPAERQTTDAEFVKRPIEWKSKRQSLRPTFVGAWPSFRVDRGHEAGSEQLNIKYDTMLCLGRTLLTGGVQEGQRACFK